MMKRWSLLRGAFRATAESSGDGSDFGGSGDEGSGAVGSVDSESIAGERKRRSLNVNAKKVGGWRWLGVYVFIPAECFAAG